MLSETNPIELLASGLDVSGIAAALDENPQLWDQHKTRTAADGPHREASDIWVRCMPWEKFCADPGAFNRPHESAWYDAANVPAIRDAAERVLDLVEALKVGGVLITKIPPHAQVHPHVDVGWHARAYDKAALQVAANDDQAFHFKNKSLVTRTGDLFEFDNRYVHWVTNDSDDPRITMICCYINEGTIMRKNMILEAAPSRGA